MQSVAQLDCSPLASVCLEEGEAIQRSWCHAIASLGEHDNATLKAMRPAEMLLLEAGASAGICT